MLTLVLAVLTFQSPAADSLAAMASLTPGTALVAAARARPLLVRETVGERLRIVGVGPAGQRETALDQARRLAAAYATAWNDSFLVREVARFARWPQVTRRAKVHADSLRLAGVEAWGREGPGAAIALWRRAAAVATRIGDSAGTGAAMGNIGAGFHAEGHLDSAQTWLERARVTAGALGDLRTEANALEVLAAVSEDRGDLATARTRHAAAMALYERIGDSRGKASATNNLGYLAQSAGDLVEAKRLFEAALTINRRDGRTEAAATNLLNLAGLASLEGEFARAESLYRDALAIWRAEGQWAAVADALHGLGQLELRRGDYRSARTAFEEALQILDGSGPISAALSVRERLAATAMAAGDLQAAVDVLRRAQEIADTAQAPAGAVAGVLLARADLALALNQYETAAGWYAQAERLFRRTGDQDGLADALSGRAVLASARDDHDGARRLLMVSLRTHTASGHHRASALTHFQLGQLARVSGDTAAARRHLRTAQREFDRLGDPVATAAAEGELAGLEGEGGAYRLADSIYEGALARLAGFTAPEVSWTLHAGRATVLQAWGQLDAAARELRAAVVDIERSAGSLRLPERRTAFLADKWEVYARLATVEVRRSRPGSAFAASERLRAREMLEVLARGRIEAVDASNALVVREQDLRRRIAELTGQLVGAEPRDETSRGPGLVMARTVEEALLAAQDRYAELMLELREREPGYATLVGPQTANWRDVARRLAPDQAFVAYLVTPTTTLAFVVARDTLVTLDLGVGRRELATQAAFVRGTLEATRASEDDSLWRAPLRRLDGYLIAPIEEAGLLSGIRRLIITPHAELHYLPFAALRGGGDPEQFLVERYEIMTTPSASAWLSLGDRRRQTGEGVLALAPLAAKLPGSVAEVAAIRRLAGPGVRVLQGIAASEAAFRRQAPTRRVLHLATYGVLNKHNPLFSYVDLAARDGEDGRLEVHEVFGLRLAADLVVLSACQTGLASGMLADVPPGDDWVGLTRAFLHAGAREVVATLWPVEDAATAALMERFYEGWSVGGDAVAALARAQREMLRQPGTSHPFQWSGVVATGGAP